MKLPLPCFRFLYLTFTLLLVVPTANAQEIHACVVMPSPSERPTISSGSPSPSLPSGVQRAVALGGPSYGTSNFWPNGSTLRIRFLGGSDYVRQQVARYAREWTQHANLNFQFVDSGPSDIRISFVRNGSSWSMLGRQARSAGANQATMNFGWFTDNTPDEEFRRTVLHEFGHALGLLHEHQNPTGGIPWNENAVYAFYYRTQGWGRQTTYQNVIARQKHNETQYSAYDPHSIMHYPVDPRLTTGGYSVGLNRMLSATDAAFIAQMYPGRTFAPPSTESSSPSLPETQPSQPVASTHQLRISNQLGRGQRAEVVELHLNNRKYVFRLHEDERNQQSVRLRLQAGTYDYHVKTISVYSSLRRVWNGRRYVDRRQDQTIYGGGTGRLTVNGDGDLMFYGSYDKEAGRMRVRLGERRVGR